MEAALLARLLGVTALSTLFGKNIAWLERPRRGGLPALVMTAIAPGIEYTLDEVIGLEFAWVQFDIWSESAAAIPALKTAVRTEMHIADLPATARGRDQSGIRFHPAFVESDRTFAPEDLDGGAKLFRASTDYRFYHQPI